MNIRDFRALRFDVSKRPYDFSASDGRRLRRHVALFSRDLGVHPSAVYFMQQTHTDHVRIVEESEAKPYHGHLIIEDTDALVTDRRRVALVSRVSDCTPLVLYDPRRGVQAVIHSGWRPTVKKITQKALITMMDRYGTRPRDVFCYIGPSIGRRSFEVGKEVSALFREAFAFSRDVIRYGDRDHDFIDLKLTHIRMLQQMGVPDEQVLVNRADTFTDDRYHSFRRDKPDYGSNALMAVLK